MSKLAGKTAPCCRREERPRDAGDARADGERQQLQPVHRHRHHLGRELVLAQRPPRAAGARLVQEIEHGDDDDERREGDVVRSRRAT